MGRENILQALEEYKGFNEENEEKEGKMCE